MSSTNKTPYLGLNDWLGSDVPQRADFNSDNALVDSALGQHLEDSDIHTTAADKTKWNSPYYIMSYTGNGQSSRSMTLGCSFNPTWGMIYKINMTPQAIDISNEANYNYFAVFSKNGSEAGVSLSGKTLNLTQTTQEVIGIEYRALNDNGSTYVVIAFR